MRDRDQGMEHSRLQGNEDSILKRMTLREENFAMKQSLLNEDAERNIGLAMKLSRDLGNQLDQHRREENELVSDLIRYLKRAIAHQDLFETLVSKARKDVLHAEVIADHKSAELQRVEERMKSLEKSSSERIAELEERLREVQEELDQVKMESQKPAWKEEQEVHDPNSQVTSKEWYEAEIAYLNNRCSQLSVQCETLLMQRVANYSESRSNNSSWREGNRSRRNSSIQLASLLPDECYSPALADGCAQTQEEEFTVAVADFSPPLVLRGSLCDPPHQLLFKSLNPSSAPDQREFALFLPDNFKMVYEVSSSPESNKGRQLRRRKTLLRKSKSIRLDQARSFDDILSMQFDDNLALLPVRTLSRWIGEVWVAFIRHMKDAEEAAAPEETLAVATSEKLFGSFIWKHFLRKYGTDQIASHLRDLVCSARKHREHYPRIRMFAEFAGLDAKRPLKALKTFVMLLEHMLPPSSFDDDNALVWIAAEDIVNIVNRELKLKVLKDKTDRFLNELLPRLITCPDKDRSKRIVDVDICAECLTNLMLEGDYSVLDHILEPVVKVSEETDSISQEIFEQIVFRLDPTADEDVWVKRFHSLTKQEAGEDAISCEDMITIFKQIPLKDYERTVLGDEGKQLHVSNHVLVRASLEHFWYKNNVRIRQTIQDLEDKQARLTALLRRFNSVYSRSSPSVETTLELLMYSRMITAELLLEKTETISKKHKAARPSYFHSSSSRNASIIRALLPRGHSCF